MPRKHADSLESLQKLVDDAAKKHAGETSEQPSPPHTPRPTAKAAAKKAAPLADGEGAFFVYVDGEGTQHIVNSTKLIPKPYRKRAKRWTLEADSQNQGSTFSDGLDSLADTVQTVAAPSPLQGDAHTPFHLPSMLMGLVAGAVLFLSSYMLKKRANIVLKAVLTVIIVALASAAYMGWVRRQAGLGTDAVTTPAAMIKDAHEAARLMQRRNAAKQEILKQVDLK